jgi:nucleotide-binding universal stress UspA family protein
MSYRSVLVQIHDTDESDARFGLAASIANSFDASIIGVAAEPALIPVTTEFGYVDAGLYQQMQDDLKARLLSAKARFQKNAGTVKGGASCFAEIDYPERAMTLHARGADLLIAGRPLDSGPYAAAKPSDVIMEAGRPVLLAPKGFDALRTKQIVVAWKDTREARRAIADALPFLKQAKTVHVLSVAEGSDNDSDPSGPKEIAAYLDRHSIYCETETVQAGKLTVAECLHTAAELRSADLIVCGAYGHSRIREWVFGGVTSDLIDASPKFVLFSH